MDVTPHDLRNAELREAFRGYRPDEVEELLERAAVTLERLHERMRQVQERLAQVEQEASSGKEMESVMRQTLLLAQRTAEETLAAAHESARQLVEEAEDRALALTTEAEEQARVIGEAQRQKNEATVAELSARRDLLIADIDKLEKVQADYRTRLRALLEQELEEVKRKPQLPTPVRPELHEIDLDVPAGGGAAEPETVRVADKRGAPSAPSAQSPMAGDDESDGGPPTEALVVLDDELADSGPSASPARRRG